MKHCPPPVPPAETRKTLEMRPELLDDLTEDCVRLDEPNIRRTGAGFPLPGSPRR